MKRKTKITKYVKKVFRMYGTDGFGFFSDLDEDTYEEVEIPLFEGDDIDDETINRISTVTGLSRDEIINCDEEAASRYWKKYSYFALMDEFKSVLSWYARYDSKKMSPEELLVWAIWGDDEFPATKRYNYKTVKNRMIKQLKEMDRVMPGTWHSGAEITQLKISTDIVVSFPKITELLYSLFEMLDYVKVYFFRSLKEDLSESEILEYNFIVSQLKINDICLPSVRLTYDNVQRYKEVYLEEGYADFFKYAKINGFIDVGPWRSKEFFADMDTVYELMEIFPHAKKEMREYALDVDKFYCDFVWSDAETVKPFLEDNDVLWSEIERWSAEVYGDAYTSLPPAKEHTQIYINKDKSEISDWSPYIKQLKKFTASAAKGGVHIKFPDFSEVQSRTVMRLYRGGDL